MQFPTKGLLALGLSSSLLAGLLVAQSYPQWWLDNGVVLSQPPAAPGEVGYDPAVYDAWMADNYAVANLGQAKSLAASAMDTMEAAITGSSGSAISTMVGNFSTAPADNYVPLTIGQLKALSAPFFQRMHALDYPVSLSDGTVLAADSYPWLQNVTPDNLTVANLGQLKHTFSFDLSGWSTVVISGEPDSDGDGLTDAQELTFGSNVNLVDTDNDSLTDYQEFHLGTDPTLNDTVTSDASAVANVVVWRKFR